MVSGECTPKMPPELDDLRSAVHHAILRDIAIIVGVRLVVFIPAFLYGYYAPPVNVFGVIAVEIICIIPLFTTRIWKWFTSARALEGEIVSIKNKRKAVSAGMSHNVRLRGVTASGNTRFVGGGLSSIWAARATVCRIKVRTDAGKVRCVRYVVRDGERIADYNIGDRVRHYYGTNYIYKLPRERRAFYDEELGVPNICVMCGAVNEDDDELCDFCGASLPARVVF